MHYTILYIYIYSVIVLTAFGHITVRINLLMSVSLHGAEMWNERSVLTPARHLSASLCDAFPPTASDSQVSIKTATVIFRTHGGTLG